jgi:hypothetical protein
VGLIEVSRPLRQLFITGQQLFQFGHAGGTELALQIVGPQFGKAVLGHVSSGGWVLLIV